MELTSHEVCRLTGASYRQLDWWAKAGVVTPSITPARGSGTLRRWSADDVSLVRLVYRLSVLGATREALTRAVAEVRRNPSFRGRSIFVTPDGRVSVGTPLGHTAAWWIAPWEEMVREDAA